LPRLLKIRVPSTRRGERWQCELARALPLRQHGSQAPNRVPVDDVKSEAPHQLVEGRVLAVEGASAHEHAADVVHLSATTAPFSASRSTLHATATVSNVRGHLSVIGVHERPSPRKSAFAHSRALMSAMRSVRCCRRNGLDKTVVIPSSCRVARLSPTQALTTTVRRPSARSGWEWSQRTTSSPLSRGMDRSSSMTSYRHVDSASIASMPSAARQPRGRRVEPCEPSGRACSQCHQQPESATSRPCCPRHER
jgi:hypothetical protein